MTSKYALENSSEKRVIYQGPKNFWKAGVNVDVIIIDHLKTPCWEVVFYNAGVGSEAPRLYVYKALLYKTISTEELDTHVQTKVEALTRQKKAYQKADVIAHVTEELGIQHILNRVALHAVAVAGVGCSRVGDDMDMKSKMDIFLAAKETDAMSAEDSTLLAIVAVAEKVPGNLEPLQISMRRRASVADFHKSLSALHIDAAELQNATNMAEICITSKEGVKQLLAENMKKHLEKMRQLSVPRMRWVKAINRVLVQNYVTIIQRRVDELYPPEERQELPSWPTSTSLDSVATGGSSSGIHSLRVDVSKGLLGSPLARQGSHGANKSKKLRSRRSFDDVVRERRMIQKEQRENADNDLLPPILNSASLRVLERRESRRSLDQSPPKQRRCSFNGAQEKLVPVYASPEVKSLRESFKEKQLESPRSSSRLFPLDRHGKLGNDSSFTAAASTERESSFTTASAAAIHRHGQVTLASLR